MALSNRERVGRIMEALREGLAPYIVREYRTVYGQGTLGEMDAALSTASYPGIPAEAWQDDAALAASLDVAACLNLMWRRWNEVFMDKLGHIGRSYTSEMIEARNAWAHQEAFTTDDAHRVADTASRLLKAVSAADAAATVDAISRDLLDIKLAQDVTRSKREVTVQQPELLPTQAGLETMARRGAAAPRRRQRALHPGRVRRGSGAGPRADGGDRVPGPAASSSAAPI